MKRQTLYTAAALALTAGVLAGCSKNDIDSQAGTGAVALHVSATRAGDDSAAPSAYDPLAFQTIRIYNASDELLRRYTAASLPERLELLAGNYSVGVEVGEQVPASFEKKYYVGKQSFTVTAGQTAGVEVKCTRQNVMAKVAFDASIAEKFGTAVKVWVAAAAPEQSAELGKGSLDELTFTEAANGYFMLPEDVTTLVYKFEGTHSDPTVGNNGLITREGSLAGVSAGANCSMTFRYSEDAPGYIECFTIQVDDTTEDFTDDIVWTDISITGDGFNVEEQQDYIPGKSAAVTYHISNLTPIKDVMLYSGSTSYDLLDNTYPGITVDKTNDREMKVSLGDEFFSALGGGAQSLRLRVRDTSNGELSRTTPFRVQGLLPVGASDCDLWFNRVTLKALIGFGRYFQARGEERRRRGRGRGRLHGDLRARMDADHQLGEQLLPLLLCAGCGHGRIRRAEIRLWSEDRFAGLLRIVHRSRRPGHSQRRYGGQPELLRHLERQFDDVGKRQQHLLVVALHKRPSAPN